jgi:thiamine biosynthesis lipoprotein
VNLNGTALDLGGIAKGFAVDRAAGALRAAGADNFVVNAGGDLRVSGTKNGKPWRIGIQDPRAPDRLLRVVTPREGAFVTSGDYERYFLWEGERYHHILDPRTGRPARGCRSVTVWTRHGIDADALATAAFVLGPAEGLALLERLEEVEGLVVDDAGGELATSGFAAVAPEVPSSRPDAVSPPPEAKP